MSCLHTINRSPSAGLLAGCASMLAPGDAVLFIEDGIYHCAGIAELHIPLENISIYALKEDMLARGTCDRCVGNVEIVDYDRFVELCCEFEKIISWF